MYTPCGISTQIFKRFFQKTFTVLLLSLIVITKSSLGQVQENFSDGDFDSDPGWSGTTSKFVVTANQLKLQAPAVTENAFLSTSSTAINNALWEFYIKLDFNTTSGNYARVYLVADQADLSLPLNGYFVMIGNTSDEVSLYRQTGATKSEIIDGLDARVKTSIPYVVRVTRDSQGNWELYSDEGATGVFALEGAITNTNHLSSAYAGVYCEYTSANSTKFTFDDIVITGQPFADILNPVWQNVTVISSTELLLEFSEALNEESAENVSNYLLGDNLPVVASLSADDRFVQLVFSEHFPNGISQQLQVSAVTDLALNSIETSSKDVLFFQPGPVNFKDIIITEIYPDYNPSFGLPEGEYVELYNRSTNPISLEGWHLTDGVTVSALPLKIMLPGEHLALAAGTTADALNNIGNTRQLSTLPSLNNATDKLTLLNASDEPIDSVRYFASWYADVEKDDGGWSLELIDVNDLCRGSSNWSASTNPIGGTPGQPNSIAATLQDVIGPQIISVEKTLSNRLTIQFSERLSSILPPLSAFASTPALAFNDVQFSSDRSLHLSFTEELDEGRMVKVEIAAIADCPGNVASTTGWLNFDDVAPQVDQINVVSNNQLEISFSEKITLASKDAANFSVDGANPSEVLVLEDNLRLTFEHPFQNGVTKQLEIEWVEDINSNGSPAEISFLFFERLPYHYGDLIFTEVYPDFSPQVALPNAEYVELYNAGDAPLQLTGWTLTDGNSTGIFPDKILLPGKYLIVCATTSTEQFAPFGDVVGLSNFPTLNNSGDKLKVADDSDTPLDSIEYALAWFGNEDKDAGGWSLERVDLDDVCLGSKNWSASIASMGGTPGHINSIYAELTDSAPPHVQAVTQVATNQVKISFDEKLSATVGIDGLIQFEAEDVTVSSVETSDGGTAIIATVNEKFLYGKSYVIKMTSIRDCPGNLHEPFTVQLNPDHSAPRVDSIRFQDEEKFAVYFSEKIGPLTSSSLSMESYDLRIAPINDSTIAVSVVPGLPNGKIEHLSINEIADLNGNAWSGTIELLYFMAKPHVFKDIVISEVLPDFSPAIGLPDGEFVEIYNRSANPIELKDWTISDGSTAGKLPPRILLPDSYLILTSMGLVDAFSTYSDVLGISKFPSLNNDEEVLTLTDSKGVVIDSVRYFSSWYRDNEKKAGGWTLELIDLDDFCKNSYNWMASSDQSGGTPGKRNSAYSRPDDKTAPQILSATQLAPKEILVSFDEPVQGQLAADNLIINPLLPPLSLAFIDSDRTKLDIRFENEIVEGLTYKLFLAGLQDCAGNPLDPSHDHAFINLDEIPPAIDSVVVVSKDEVILYFSEKIAPMAQDNFEADGEIPSMIIYDDQSRTAALFFETDFENGLETQLIVRSVQDRNGNVLNTSITFVFFQAHPHHPKDVLITEIFADPVPVRGLPEAEFIEITNRSTHPINLQDWILTDGSTEAKLPSRILPSGARLILCARAAVSGFLVYGPAIGFTNWPSLNNNGDNISLLDNQGILIDSVAYTLKWYHDDGSSDGGVSLELIDLDNICAEESNWIASVDESGGTPGRENSVNASKPDLTPPQRMTAMPTNATEILLQFDEKLEFKDPALASLIIAPSTMVSKTIFKDRTLRAVLVTLERPLQNGVRYTITAGNVADCAGNSASTIETFFGLPEAPDFNDIVINEVLFNPKPGGIDFVELFNRSTKFINLKNWRLANQKDGLENLRLISPVDLLLAPGDYILLSTDATLVNSQYPKEEINLSRDLDELPSLTDDEGNIVLIDSTFEHVDQFAYSDDMHSIFLQEKEGVSLERISANEPSGNNQNWKSASAATGFATPGYQNSMTASSEADGTLVIEPEIFEPFAGTPSFTQIHYKFDHGGTIANVRIFDSDGHMVKTIASNELLGTSGFFRWDGDNDNGEKADVGHYLVAFETFDERGTSRTLTKRVVIATQF